MKILNLYILASKAARLDHGYFSRVLSIPGGGFGGSEGGSGN